MCSNLSFIRNHCCTNCIIGVQTVIADTINIPLSCPPEVRPYMPEQTYKNNDEIEFSVALTLIVLTMTRCNFEAMDAGRSTLLGALDVLAEIDIIDHINISAQLKHTFHVSEQASCWVASCLHVRYIFVK